LSNHQRVVAPDYHRLTRSLTMAMKLQLERFNLFSN
jgi:hypothetical protein